MVVLTLEEKLKNLFTRTGKQVTLGLTRPRRACAAFGNPQLAYPTAVVTGTNGKGTTAATLASIVGAAGYRTGLYTSPHLVRFNERIRVNGEAIDDATLERLLDAVAGRLGVDLSVAVAPGAITDGGDAFSFFEVATVVAFEHFREQGVEFAVLEVGMGGRLDATNTAEPVVTVMTSIGHDHLAILGPTLRDVAREKLGITRRGVRLVSGVGYNGGAESAEARGALALLRETAGAVPFPLTELGVGGCAMEVAADGTFAVREGGRELGGLSISLAGAVARQNAALAVLAAFELERKGFSRIGDEAIRSGVAAVRWPGRLQTVRVAGRPPLLLDGAHNHEAMNALAASLSVEPFAGEFSRCRVVVALSRDREPCDVLGSLLPFAREVICVRTGHPTSVGAEVIAEALRGKVGGGGYVVRVGRDVDAVVGEWFDTGDASPWVFAGSLYLVGEVLHGLMARGCVRGDEVLGVSASRGGAVDWVAG